MRLTINPRQYVKSDDAKAIADNMTNLHGKETALKRCQGYVSGKIKSENSKEFWQGVLNELLRRS